MLIKSTDEYPILYDVSLHVPLIVRTPNGAENHIISDLVELVDLCPTLLDIAGLEVAPELQGHSQRQALQGDPAYKREYIFAESGAVKTIRSQTHKLVYYPGQPYGELYDLEQDPHEMQNLYQDPNHRDLCSRMTQDLLNKLIQLEGPRHGESQRGPAYWKKLYDLPFKPEYNLP